MEMPFETRLHLEQLENIIKEICARNHAQTMREIEPYTKAISSIRSMYPPTILLSEAMAAVLLGGKQNDET